MTLPDVSVYVICIGVVFGSRTYKVNQTVSVTEVSVVQLYIGQLCET